jgi:hypothetical protein
MSIVANLPKSRTADNNSLDRVIDTRSLARLPLVSGMTRREYRWISFLAVLVRLGYSRIRAFEGRLTDCEARAQGAAGSSRSTTYRALADLEIGGWINRGGQSAGRMLLIDFTPKLIDFVNGIHLRAVPEKSDNILPVSSCDTLDRTIKPSSFPIPSRSVSTLQSDARARGDCKVKTEKRYHPVVYSLRCVCPGAMREILTAIAVAEIEAGGSGGRSGVDWCYWAARWGDLGIAARENLAVAEILPGLRAALVPGRSSRRGPVSVDELASTIAGGCDVGEVGEEGPPADPELAVLWWARRNLRARLGGVWDS